jgi:hypothetical protein
MSNRDFDDDFNFDDDFDTGSGDDLSDDLSPDFGDDGDSGDLPDLDDEPVERGDGGGGPSRTFIMIAGIMIALFVIGLIALVLIAINGDGGDTELEIQATTIVAQNMTTEAQLTQTNEAIGTFNAVLTLEASFTDTPTQRPTVTPTFTPTDAPTLDSTQLAGTVFAETAQAEAFQTETAIAQLSDIPPTSTGISIEAVAQTATALAAALGATPTTALDGGQSGGGDVPTREGPSTTSGQLPDAGFFDEAGGRDGVGIAVLMGFGLVGVIFISRRLRAANTK